MTGFVDHISRFIRAVLPQEIGEDEITALVNNTIAQRPTRRRNNNFWASSLNSPYDCNRKQAFGRTESIWTDAEPEDPSNVRRMDCGTSLHAWAQNSWFGPSRWLFGNWECPSCGLVRRTLQTLPRDFCDGSVTVTYSGLFDEPHRRTCAEHQQARVNRGEPAWLYKEIAVRDDLNISCRIDLVLLRPGGVWYTGEMKTVDALGFKEMTTIKLSSKKIVGLPKDLEGVSAIVPGWVSLPKPEHLSQAAMGSAILLDMCEKGQVPLDPKKYAGSLIIYINREVGAFRVFKRRNSRAEYERGRETVIRVRKAVREALEASESDRRSVIMKQLPLQCSTRTDAKASRCPWRTVCFPYKNPAKNKVTAM